MGKSKIIGAWIWGTIIVGSIAYAVYAFGFSPLWYSLEYSVSPRKVYIDSKPTDCNFWHAPVGFKDCRYQRFVWTMGNGGKPQYHYDIQTGRLIDLRTNEEASEPLLSTKLEASYRADSVHVSWVKKSD
jgi:hypothetical protein